MPTVLIYARASNDPDEKKVSVDRQVKLCTERAHQLWPDAEIRVFRDDGITAADPEVHRPGYNDFITAVRSARKNELVGIVVNEQSRLTRQPAEWNELVITLTKAGITSVETIRMGPISVEAGNRLVGGILALVDAEEVERTKARVQVAHRDLFTEGRPSGRAPYGYRSDRDDDKRPMLLVDPDQAAIVEQVFEWAFQGIALAVIADKLNSVPVPSPSAGWKRKTKGTVRSWSPSTVRTVLTAPSVAGLRAHTDTDGLLHTVPARWTAIIDTDRWRQVQRLLDQPTTVTGTNGEEYRVRTMPAPQPRRYLLSGGRRRSGVPGQPGDIYGVLHCGKCGFPLVAQTQTRPGGVRVPAYACHPKVHPDACGGVSISPAEKVEELVIETIRAELARSPKLRHRLDITDDAEMNRWRAERDAAKVDMREITARRKKLSWDDFDSMYDEAKGVHDAAEARLASMATDLALPSVDDVLHRWDSLTLIQRRAVIGRLVESIVIAPSRGGRPGFNPDRVGDPTWLA